MCANSTSHSGISDKPVGQIVSRLAGVKRSGNGYTARCPVHDDRHASLSISEGNDGRALLKCHAGCDTEDVLARLGLTSSDLFERHKRPSEHRRLTSKTDYQFWSAEGHLVAVHRRFDHDTRSKSFAWYTAEGYRAGRTGLDGMPQSALPLYRLPELLAAPIDEPVLLCEGEKATDSVRTHGFTAVSLPGGASQRDFGEALKPLVDRTVILWPDNDEPGRELMKAVASALAPIAKEVRWLELAGSSIAEKDDAFDYFGKGGTADKLRLMMDATPAVSQTLDERLEEPRTRPQDNNYSAPQNEHSSEEAATAAEDKGATANPAATAEGEQAVERKSQATRLVEMALAQGCELFHTPEGHGYIRFHVAGHVENHPLQSKAARLYLERLYYSETRAVPGSQGIQDALSVLDAKARYEGGEHQVYVRLAGHDDAIYIDLADKHWQVIKVTRAGWDIVTGNDVPVMFRRPKGILPLVTPERGGRM